MAIILALHKPPKQSRLSKMLVVFHNWKAFSVQKFAPQEHHFSDGRDSAAVPINTIEAKLGSYIKSLRERADISQAEFAESLEITEAKVFSIEQGTVFITGEQLLRIAKLLNVHPYRFYHYIKEAIIDMPSLKRKDMVMQTISKWGLLAIVRNELIGYSENPILDNGNDSD